MKYWLHRITGGDFAQPYVKPLLDQGYLSIGWKGLSNEENRKTIQEKGWSAVNDILLRNGWELNRSRYCLSRFIADMNKGDIVVVPAPGSFSISSNPQPIGFSGILLAKRQNSFYCTYFLHNRNVADTKSPYPIKRLEVIRWFNQKSMVFNQSLS